MAFVQEIMSRKLQIKAEGDEAEKNREMNQKKIK